MGEKVARAMVDERSWQEFRDAGLLWFVNRILHVFGWAIVLVAETGDGGEPANIVRSFPARVLYRGFDQESEMRGYKRLGEYLSRNGESLDVDESMNEDGPCGG